MFKWIYELKAKLQEKLSEKGQGMTEYAIILAVVAVVAVAVFYGKDENSTGLEGTISNAYDTANSAINKVNEKASAALSTAGGTTGTETETSGGNGGNGQG